MKDFSESDIETAYETFSEDMKPNRDFRMQSIGRGSDNGTSTDMALANRTRSLGRNKCSREAPPWWNQMNNYIEEWGESYCGRALNRQEESRKIMSEHISGMLKLMIRINSK